MSRIILPERVDVDGHVYRIEVMPPEIAQELEIVGDVNHRLRRIRIDTTKPARTCGETLDHEIAHVLYEIRDTPRRMYREATLISLSGGSQSDAVMHEYDELVVQQCNDSKHGVQCANLEVFEWILRMQRRG